MRQNIIHRHVAILKQTEDNQSYKTSNRHYEEAHEECPRHHSLQQRTPLKQTSYVDTPKTKYDKMRKPPATTTEKPKPRQQTKDPQHRLKPLNKNSTKHEYRTPGDKRNDTSHPPPPPRKPQRVRNKKNATLALSDALWTAPRPIPQTSDRLIHEKTSFYKRQTNQQTQLVKTY